MLAPQARALLNAGLFQLGWFSCVMGRPLIATLVAPLILVLHLTIVVPAHQRMRELRWLIGFTALGMVVDGSLSLAGGYTLPAQASDGITTWLPLPVWMWWLWPLFASTIHHALSWLWQRPWLAAVGGAVSAPLSYYGGAQLAGIGLADWLLPVQALIWAGLCLGITRLHPGRSTT